MTRSSDFRRAARDFSAIPALLIALLVTGCAQSFVAVRSETHPDHSSYLVSASFEERANGYYSTAITIRNLSSEPLAIAPSMFRLDGSGSTTFVAAGHMPTYMGLAGYRMPPRVEPRSTASGEIFYGIRGTPVPFGPVRLVVDLPDGDHTFEFDLIQ